MTAKSYVKIVIVGFALCLAMVLCASFAKYRSEQSFIDDAENGFGIDGMYVNDGATRTSMAILAGEDMEWQICNDDGSCLSGRLAATSDPNSFDLLDNDGEDCGSVHLSYASRDGMDGILYVSHETGDFKMRRTNRVPAFFEEGEFPSACRSGRRGIEPRIHPYTRMNAESNRGIPTGIESVRSLSWIPGIQRAVDTCSTV